MDKADKMLLIIVGILVIAIIVVANIPLPTAPPTPAIPATPAPPLRSEVVTTVTVLEDMTEANATGE